MADGKKIKDEFEEITHDEYLRLFSIERFSRAASPQEKALGLALEIRKLEIDLYWKRAGYFWTFIGAALAGFLLIQNSNISDKTYWSVVLGSLGLVFSFACLGVKSLLDS